VGLVEEEDQLGLVQVAGLGKALKELREQPQEEGRVEGRGLDQLVRGEDVDIALPLLVGLHQVLDA
jgi:hypothetical protein